ncbi:MAG: ABC transporter substrate-binding protein [Desulfurellaceae bacterium]|nr:ABC transporter substrate-binding protein [Desulfurellaceae bacterium]
MRRRFVSLFFCIFLILFSFPSYAIEKVGCLLPLSGNIKYFSLSFFNGLSIPLSEASIQTIVKDISSEDLQKQLKELIQKDRVNLIVGPFLSMHVKACIPIIERYDVPLITPFAQSSDIPGISPLVFRFTFYPDDIRYLVDFAIEDLYSEDFMILCPDTAYGLELRTAFMDEVIKKEGHVVKIKIYKSKDMEYSSCIKQAFEVKDEGNFTYGCGVKFDTLFVAGNRKDLKKILSLIAFYDIYPRAILGNEGWNDSCIVSLPLGCTKNSYFIAGYYLDNKEEQNEHFVRKYKELYGKNPTLFSALGYDIGKMIVEAKECKTGNCIVDYLNSLQNRLGVTGKLVKFNNGDAEKIPFLLTIKNRKIVPVKSQLDIEIKE